MALIKALTASLKPLVQGNAMRNGPVPEVQVQQMPQMPQMPPIQRNPFDTMRGQVPAPISDFTPMQAGGGQWKMAPEEDAPWYKDRELMSRLALGFNTMRLTPDQGLASSLRDRIKTASEMKLTNKTAQQVAVALQNQGRFEEAALIEANPEMAKTVLSAMFTGDRAKTFKFMSGAQLNKERNTDVFDPKKPYKVSSTGEISEIGGGGVTNILNAGEKGDVKWAEKSSDAIASEFGEYRAAGAVAANIVPEIQALQALADMVPSGPIVGALAEKFQGFSTAGDAFMSIIKRIAPKMRVVGSGASSDRDVQLLLDSLGSMKNNPIANKFIYQAFLDKAEIDKQRASIARLALTGKISRQDAMDQIDELNGRSIISPQLQAIIDNIGSGAPEGANPDAWSKMSPSERLKYERMDADQRKRAEQEVLNRQAQQ